MPIGVVTAAGFCEGPDATIWDAGALPCREAATAVNPGADGRSLEFRATWIFVVHAIASAGIATLARVSRIIR